MKFLQLKAGDKHLGKKSQAMSQLIQRDFLQKAGQLFPLKSQSLANSPKEAQ